VLIVAGSYEVEPDQREEFIEGRRNKIRATRAEAGCLEFTIAADPIEPGRVLLFERWAHQAALDVHIAGMQPPPPGGVEPKSVAVVLYDISGERTLGS